MNQSLKGLDSSQMTPWDLQMRIIQVWKETCYLDYYQIWQSNRQVLSELSTWVEKQIILDPEDMETIDQE